jgi:hypothetical protein
MAGGVSTFWPIDLRQAVPLFAPSVTFTSTTSYSFSPSRANQLWLLTGIDFSFSNTSNAEGYCLSVAGSDIFVAQADLPTAAFTASWRGMIPVDSTHHVTLGCNWAAGSMDATLQGWLIPGQFRTLFT